MHSLLANRRHFLPRRDSIGFPRVRFFTCGRPSQNNHFGHRLRHLLLGDFLPGGHNHFTSTNVHQLCHPRRGADSRVRPCFTINSNAPWFSSTALPDGRESGTHRSDQAIGVWQVAGYGPEQSNIAFNVRECPRIHGQKIQWMRQQFGNRFLFVRHGANGQGGLESQNLIHGFQVPAIA